MGQTFLFGGLIIGGNEDMKATALWTNTNPTTAVATFTNITLSKDITQYPFFIVKSRDTTASTVEHYVLYPNPTITNSTTENYTIACTDTHYCYLRPFSITSATTIQFSGCCQVGFGSYTNTSCIPLAVYGVEGSVTGI